MIRLRALLTRAGLVCASLLVSLVAAELGVRWLLPPPRAQIAYESLDPGDAVDAIGTASLLVSTPQGLRLRPSSQALVKRHRVSHREITLRTNSLGLRGPELDQGSVGRRVLFLGDSITVGDHLPEDETYVAMVQRLAGASGLSWETVNAGISSTAAEDYLALLEAIGPEVRPDIVVVGLFLNDYRRSLSVRATAPPRWLMGSWLACHIADALTTARETSSERSFLAAHRDRLALGLAEIEERFPALEPAHTVDPGFKAVVAAASHDWGGAWTEEAWQRIDAALAAIKEVSDSLAASTVVMLFPARAQVEAEALFDYPQRRARASCQRLGVVFLDVLPRFRAEYAGSCEPVFYDHCHTTAFGNRLIAEEVIRLVAAPADSPG